MCSRLTRIIQRRLLTVTGDAQDLRTCSPLLIRRITSFIFTMRTVLLRLYTFLTENKPRPTSFRWKKKKEKSFILYFFPLLKTITGSIKPETCTRVKELPKTCRQILVGLLVHVGCFSYILKEKYFFGKEKKIKNRRKKFWVKPVHQNTFRNIFIPGLWVHYLHLFQFQPLSKNKCG